jgi:hypothetical protein
LVCGWIPFAQQLIEPALHPAAPQSTRAAHLAARLFS